MTRKFSLFLFFAFASFIPCLSSEQTLAIFTYEDHRQKPWDRSAIVDGVTGSEEAVIYIGDELAKLGYKVTIFGYPPENSPDSEPMANPRYVGMQYDDGTVFDVGIVWRQPWYGTHFKQKSKTLYLWPHDTLDRVVDDIQVKAFDDVLWLSKWQKEQWSSVAPSFNCFNQVFGNGLNTKQFGEIVSRRNPYSCIYSSNYARGLEILLDIWPRIKAIFPKATLDIYYGWQHWGSLSKEKEVKMRNQVEELKNFGVVDHAMVGHDELHKAYEKTSLWTYPCIMDETFCITGIKAQYAGAVPVVLKRSALNETVRHGFSCIRSDDYLHTLILAMLDIKEISLEERVLMRGFIEEEYTWKVIAENWHNLFLQK